MLTVYKTAVELQANSECQWCWTDQTFSLLNEISQHTGIPMQHLRIALAEGVDLIYRSRIDSLWRNLTSRLQTPPTPRVDRVLHLLVLRHLQRLDRDTASKTLHELQRDWYSALSGHADDLRRNYTDAFTDSIDHDISQL